jgi:cupin 2 domain-containing protein
MGNLFAGIAPTLSRELTRVLVQTPSVRIERIVSPTRRMRRRKWYDQPRTEWVTVLRGSAGLRFEDQDDVVVLRPGDWIEIAAHRRHRVAWTDPAQPTVWLALHYVSPRSVSSRGAARRTRRRALSS